LIILGLTALTLAAFVGPLRQADFMSVDDQDYVADNPNVQQGLTWAGVRWAFGGTHVANYHPLTWLSHMVDCQIFGGDAPGAYHVVNVLIHTLNAVLLFLVLKRLTGREGCSAFVAALFAVHPQHVESVAWIAERKDVLSGLFWILTIGAYVWYCEAPSWKRYALVLLMFALGLLSKPMVVTLPCVLLLLDCWPLKRPARFGSGRVVVEKIPMILMAVALSVATLYAQRAGRAMVPLDRMPVWWRIGNATVSYVRYLRQFVLPIDLAAFYPLALPWATWFVLVCGVGLVVLSAVALLSWRRRPYLTVGWLWFMGTLVPVIGLVHVGSQSMADRYMYLPMIGLGIAVAWLAAELLAERWPRALAGSAVAVVLACAFIAHNEAGYWKNGETLYTRAMERTGPNVFNLHNIAAGMVKRGAPEEACKVLAEAIRIQPNNAHVHRLYGYALRESKHLPEAEKELAISLQINPEYARTWTELGQVYIAEKRWSQAAEALRRAIVLRPEDFDSHINLAIAYRMSEDREHALAEMRTAADLRPLAPKPWYMIGALMLESDQPKAAIEPLRKCIALKPNDADAQLRLGLALMRSGQGASAVAPLMKAVQLSPGSPEPMTHLAWVLATHPDEKLRSGADAVALAGRADELSKGTSPDALNALAAGLAEQHRYEEAGAAATKAMQLAREAKDERLAGDIEKRIAVYRQGQAVRDAALAGNDLRDLTP
jgi:protein O-mannosyl-transferase